MRLVAERALPGARPLRGQDDAGDTRRPALPLRFGAPRKQFFSQSTERASENRLHGSNMGQATQGLTNRITACKL